jgi:CysZ protein
MLNIKNAISSFALSHRMLWRDKVNILFTFTPITIGIILYYYLGSFIYTNAMEWGQRQIEGYVSGGGFADFLSWLMVAILTVFLFFLVNWTFVMIVTLIASPFNDFLSARIEKKLRGEKTLDVSESIGQMLKNLVKVLFIEAKKIVFIGFFTVIALLLSFFPILVPVSLILTAILFATQFADYSWARHEWDVKKCLGDVKSNFLPYAAVGGFFMLLVSIPFVNLIVPAWATSYFTVLWVKSHEQ